MGNLAEKHVVTSFLERNGLVLLLRRSGRVGTFRDKWAGVSGYVESTPDEQSIIEIFEETGLASRQVTLLKKGTPLTVDDSENGVKWIIHPFYYSIKPLAEITTNWEHTEIRWIRPEQIGEFKTVPKLAEALLCVLP